MTDRVSCGALSLGALAGLAALGFASFAQAQTSAADLAQYSGTDRQARLLEGAKKEGGLTLYSSATNSDMKQMIAGFEKKYPGVKVKFWRSDSESILQRVVQEAHGNRFDVDVVETSGGTMEALYREKLLQPVKSPVLADISGKAKFPHGAWTGSRFQVQTIAYNTNLVKKSDLPKTWSDLLDPKWKDKIGIELDDAEWFGVVAKSLGEDKGLKLWREIAAKNNVSVRKGHTLLANLTASGEVPMALGVYDYKIQQMKAAGAPIDTLDLDPLTVHPIGIALAARAPHPHAGLLFFDFLLSDGQKIYITQHTQPTNIRVKAEPSHAIFINFGESLDETEKWQKLFRETFITKR
jgi:iron(III) transport system substrate-binding protein